MPTIEAMLKSFGQSTRLRILRLVAAQELAVNELVEILEVPQSRVSRHLAVLRQVGVTEVRREGNCVYYRMDAGNIDPFAGALWRAIRAHQGYWDFFPGDLEHLRQVVEQREARTKEYFEVVVAEWDRIRRNYIDEALSFLAVSSLVGPGAVVVDVGTGTGEVLLSLAQAAAKAIGVDRSQKMLDVCRQRVERSGIENVELLLGEAEDVPLDDCACDAAFSSMLLHHLADPAVGVRELVRIVKPTGKVVISDLVKHEYDWTREVMADVWLGFTEEQIRQWLTEAGATDVAYWSTPVPSPVEPESTKLRAFIATGTKPQKKQGTGNGTLRTEVASVETS